MDIPLIAEATRLSRIAAKFPDESFLPAKLAQARTRHDAAAVFVAMWLQTSDWPSSEGLNAFLTASLSLAKSIMQSDYRTVVSIETFSLSKSKHQSTYGKVAEPVQSRLTTKTHDGCYAEAGGLSDEARQEQARVRESSGVYAGPRRVGKPREKCRPFDAKYPLHWK